MASQSSRSADQQHGATSDAPVEGDIALLLERVCARLPHGYTRQLVRDVVRLKLEMGFEGDVRDYLKRRSGEYPALPTLGRRARREG